MCLEVTKVDNMPFLTSDLTECVCMPACPSLCVYVCVYVSSLPRALIAHFGAHRHTHTHTHPHTPSNDSWDYNRNISVPFIAMVFDQCTDPICDQTGYLDFDVYNELQPVFNGTSGGDGDDDSARSLARPHIDSKAHISKRPPHHIRTHNHHHQKATPASWSGAPWTAPWATSTSWST